MPIICERVWDIRRSTWIYFRLYCDPAFGKKVGIGQIAHGMMVMGFAGEALTNWISKKHLRKLSVRFVGMTRPGDVVIVTGKITEKKQEGEQYIVWGEIVVRNQKDEMLLSGSFEAAHSDTLGRE